MGIFCPSWTTTNIMSITSMLMIVATPSFKLFGQKTGKLFSISVDQIRSATRFQIVQKMLLEIRLLLLMTLLHHNGQDGCCARAGFQLAPDCTHKHLLLKAKILCPLVAQIG